jgi:hypothetical protein
MPIKIFCNNCDKVTNHSLLASVDEHGEQGVVHWKDTYQILKCSCGNVTVRKQQWCSEWQEPNSEPHYNYTFLPPRHFRKKPKWFSQLDQKLIDVLDEVYAALQHGLYYVATVGIRTVLDMVMVDKVKDIGENEDKYAALLAKGIVTENQLDLLKVAIEAGNAAAHRGYRPSADDLKHLIVITETIIEKLNIAKRKEEYLLGKAFEIKSKVPLRERHRK